MNTDDMRHSPSCQQLIVIRTEGYSVTVYRCDECGAVTTTSHGTPNPQPKIEAS